MTDTTDDGVVDTKVLTYTDQITELAQAMEDRLERAEERLDRALDQRDHYQASADELITERDQWEADAKQAWADRDHALMQYRDAKRELETLEERHRTLIGEYQELAARLATGDVSNSPGANEASETSGEDARPGDGDAEPRRGTGGTAPRASFGSQVYHGVVYPDGSLVENTDVTGNELRVGDLDAAPVGSVLSRVPGHVALIKHEDGRWHSTGPYGWMDAEDVSMLPSRTLTYPVEYRQDAALEPERALPDEPGSVVLVTEFRDVPLPEPFLAVSDTDGDWWATGGATFLNAAQRANPREITGWRNATVEVDDDE